VFDHPPAQKPPRSTGHSVTATLGLTHQLRELEESFFITSAEAGKDQPKPPVRVGSLNFNRHWQAFQFSPVGSPI
jgi:hypothetical protein